MTYRQKCRVDDGAGQLLSKMNLILTCQNLLIAKFPLIIYQIKYKHVYVCLHLISLTSAMISANCIRKKACT